MSTEDENKKEKKEFIEFQALIQGAAEKARKAKWAWKHACFRYISPVGPFEDTRRLTYEGAKRITQIEKLLDIASSLAEEAMRGVSEQKPEYVLGELKLSDEDLSDADWRDIRRRLAEEM